MQDDNSKGLEDADFSALEGEALAEGEIQEGASGDGESKGASSRAEQGDPKRGEVAEFREKYLRALAELENFKKRSLKERSDLLKYQGERVLHDILPVMDNLELALHHAESDPSKVKQGIEMIHKMFVEILSKWEVRGESGIGKEFDPAKFAALSRVPAHDAVPGTIINELKKAYFYKDKLLRPGEVIVASEPPKNDSQDGPESGQE